MGLFDLLSWAVALSCPLTAGWGLVIVGPPHDNYRGARVCFYISAAALWGFAVAWGVRSKYSLPISLTVVAVLAAVAAMGLVLALRTVAHRERAAASSSVPTTPGTIASQSVLRAEPPAQSQTPLSVPPIDLTFEQHGHAMGRAYFSNDASEDSWVYTFGPATITNLRSTDKVALRVYLHLKHPNGLDVRVPNNERDGNGRLYNAHVPELLAKAKMAQLPAFAPVIEVAPQSTAQGRFVFILPSWGKDANESFLRSVVGGPVELTLVVKDAISGAEVEIPAGENYRGAEARPNPAKSQPERQNSAESSAASRLHPPSNSAVEQPWTLAEQGLFIECQEVATPKKFGPDGNLYEFTVLQAGDNPSGGSGRRFGTPDGDVHGPDYKGPPLAWKCAVTNFNSHALVNIRIPITIHILRKEKENTYKILEDVSSGQSGASIPKIEAGKTFTFYAFNGTKSAIRLEFGKMGLYRPLSEDEDKQVRVVTNIESGHLVMMPNESGIL